MEKCTLFGVFDCGSLGSQRPLGGGMYVIWCINGYCIYHDTNLTNENIFTKLLNKRFSKKIYGESGEQSAVILMNLANLVNLVNLVI